MCRAAYALNHAMGKIMKRHALMLGIAMTLGTPRGANASRCNQVADDDYSLLVLGSVETARESVRASVCPVAWDAKKQVWHGSSAAIKQCLHGQIQRTVNGKPRTSIADLDPDPRSAHFVFPIVMSGNQSEWWSFAKLVHVETPKELSIRTTSTAIAATSALGMLVTEFVTKDA